MTSKKFSAMRTELAWFGRRNLDKLLFYVYTYKRYIISKCQFCRIEFSYHKEFSNFVTLIVEVSTRLFFFQVFSVQLKIFDLNLANDEKKEKENKFTPSWYSERWKKLGVLAGFNPATGSGNWMGWLLYFTHFWNIWLSVTKLNDSYFGKSIYKDFWNLWNIHIKQLELSSFSLHRISGKEYKITFSNLPTPTVVQ